MSWIDWWHNNKGWDMAHPETSDDQRACKVIQLYGHGGKHAFSVLQLKEVVIS